MRRNNTLEKGLKDYMVPIIGLILIIIILFSFFSGNSEPEVKKIELENKVGLNLQMDSENAESYIVYPGDYKKQIEGDTTLYKGEKVIVKEGKVSLKLPDVLDFNLNKLGELEYTTDGKFKLTSSDLWLNAKTKVDVDMNFANVSIGEGSNISFSQNEFESTIYVVNGFAEVTNLVGNSTVLASGEQISISRLQASDKDIDFSTTKGKIDDTFKRSTWFIVNNGSSYLNLSNKEEDKSSTGSTVKKNLKNSLIVLNNLIDESNVSSDNINISGSYTDEEITKVTLNNIEAKLNKETKTFIFENVSVSSSSNDLVFKVYDDSNDLLEKFVYTVYYEGGVVQNTSTSKFKVKTFDVDGSKFIFTSPTTKDIMTTYDTFVTIRGKVLAKGISKVIVNGYTLKSFRGSTWRYHADTKYDNLHNGTNVYNVNYYDSSNNLVYKNTFTIIKKDRSSEKKEKSKIEEKKIISDEIKIN